MDNSNAAIMVRKERIVMLSVLHVITNFSAVGGAEMMLSRLIKAQPNVKHFIVSLMKINQEIYSETLEQCSYVDSLSWNGINTLKTILKLKKVIKELNPDIIQGWMYHANVLTSLSLMGVKDRPKVFWGIHHSLTSIKEESLSTKIALIFSRYLSHSVSTIIYCAQSSQEQHQAFGFKSLKHTVIPNGIQLENFTLSNDIHNPCIVGFAGRYHPAKGYQYLFETISLLKDYPIFFKIAGKGANLTTSEISDYFKKYELDAQKVILLDQVSNMSEFYTSIDLFLLTSITEGFPNVLVEAMASGVPCVTTNVGDAEFIVQKNGYVVASRNSQQLSEAILSYVKLSIEEKKELKFSSRQRVESSFSIEKVSKQYLSVWENIS